MELPLQVLVDPKVAGYLEDTICYETGLTRAQAADPQLYAYEHHGEGFTATDPGALTSFFEDVLLGRPLPLKFATPQIRLDTLFAIALFLHRDLATHPAMPGLIANVDLVHRRGLAMYAHIEPDVTLFFRLLGALFPQKQSKGEQGDHLRAAITWIYEFVQNGTLPHLGPALPEPTLLELGSNGFVFASLSTPDLHGGWVELYRRGFLRGVLLGPSKRDRHPVLASRKSVYVDFNLSRAAEILNEMERAMGEPPEWVADELWLHGPEDGTLILVSQLVEVFVRV